MPGARRRTTIRRRRRVGFSGRGKFWFDQQTADDAVLFVETFCSHVKGEWAGQPLILEPWQKWLIEELFGWKRKDHPDPRRCTRQFRVLWLEIPRKNGKSALAAALALLLLCWDDEPGAEIYSAAADRDQAAIVFDMARQMVLNDEDLEGMLRVYGGSTGHRRSIVNGNSFYRVLSADAHTKHGYNAHGIIVDEVHVQKQRHLIDTLRTSVGSRRQPIEIYITTAGDSRTTICWEMHTYAERVIAGSYNAARGVKDDSWLPVIYGADVKDNWQSPKVWKKANPNLGVSVKIEYLEQQAKEAAATPAYENTFRRLHLDQWTTQDVRWLQMHRWDRGRGALPDDLVGRRAWAGLDLASNSDLNALVLAFEPDHEGAPIPVLPYFWIPEEAARAGEGRGVPYEEWRRDGHVFVTPGNVSDYDFIRAFVSGADVFEDSEQAAERLRELGYPVEGIAYLYGLEEIAIDRWNAAQITTQLTGDGHTVVPFGQGYASMSAPAKSLERLVKREQILHAGHPCLRWCAENVAIEVDPAGNIKPSKKASSEKIDGVVALVMALARMEVHLEQAMRVTDDFEVMVV